MEVVILCGGKGTRSYPFTEYFPKVMMPVGGSPIIVHLMRLYASQGITNFILAAGHRKEILIDYFADRNKEWDIRIVDTGDEADTGERLLQCASYIEGNTFCANYGDGLGNVDLHSLLDFHRRAGGLATVTVVPLRSQYGTVKFDRCQKVIEFREKPIIQDYWINAGFFVLEKEVFSHWKGKNLEQEVLPHLAFDGVLYSYLHEGFWKSMDTSKDQRELDSICSLGRPPWMQVPLVRRVGAAD